jgi:hypothetical protein
LPTDSLKEAEGKFANFLANVKSKFGSPILVCHGTDYNTLLNNFATVDYDARVCETITGVVNIWNVINEDDIYPASSSKSIVKVTDGGRNLGETVLGGGISRKELGAAHDGLLLRVVDMSF